MLRRLPLILFALWLMAVFLLAPAVVNGGELPSTMDARELRALFVQRLIKYVTWPAGAGPRPGEPCVIAATDSHSLAPYFNSPELKARFTLVQWPAKQFDVLVISGTSARESAAILGRVEGLPVLTISESPDSLRQGSVINLKLVDGRFRLQVNTEAVRKSRLSISSRLMQLATIYRGGDND